MNISVDIKNIITTYIKNKYDKYILDNQLLFIKESELKNAIYNIYDENIKDIKSTIRDELKKKYDKKYPSMMVENVILDLFQDKYYSIGVIVNNILHLQKINYRSLSVPIYNNSLNINISIDNNIVSIVNINKNNIDDYDKNKNIYDTINKYKYIYSINDYCLTDYNDKEKIDILKKCINNNNIVDLGLYFNKNVVTNENNDEFIDIENQSVETNGEINLN